MEATGEKRERESSSGRECASCNHSSLWPTPSPSVTRPLVGGVSLARTRRHFVVAHGHGSSIGYEPWKAIRRRAERAHDQRQHTQKSRLRKRREVAGCSFGGVGRKEGRCERWPRRHFGDRDWWCGHATCSYLNGTLAGGAFGSVAETVGVWETHSRSE